VNAFVLDRTDGTADAAYAGDLLGNVWRLDLTGTTGSYPAPLRLARLRSTGDEPQPVTSRPLIEVDPRTGHRFVLVGTGRMLANADIGSTAAQSFYALRDGNLLAFAQAAQLPAGVTWPLLRGDLADNTNLLDDVSYDPGTQAGWYVELSGGGGGWRVVNDPASAFGVVTFAATQPSGDACNPSGSTRIYAISLGTGRSVLTSGPNAYISYSTALTSVVTDLRFYTVNGVARLIAGSDAGEVGAIQGMFGTPPGVRRLNWRELPVAN
jgi:type IV pilus assembly protein PilY1